MIQIKNTTKGDRSVVCSKTNKVLMIGAGKIIDLEHPPVRRKSTEAMLKAGELVVLGGEFEAEEDPSDERRAAIIAAIGQLADGDFTKEGLPKLDAVNAKLEEGTEPATSEERDAAWAEMQA